MVGKAKKDLPVSMHNLSSFIAESVQKEELINNTLIQNCMKQVSIDSTASPSSSSSSLSKTSQHVSFSTEDIIFNDCLSNPRTITKEYQQQLTTPPTFGVESISPESLPPSNLSNSNIEDMMTMNRGYRMHRKQSPYDSFAQQLSLSQYTLQSSKTAVNTTNNTSNNNANVEINNNNNNNDTTPHINQSGKETHHHHHHQHDTSKWERKLLEITRAAFVSMLGSKNKRLSEWTLMNQISESLTEITSSQSCIIMKSVVITLQTGTMESVNAANSNGNTPLSPSSQSSIRQPIKSTTTTQFESGDVHLQVIGIYGIETESAKSFVAPYRHKVPTLGPHSIFAQCYKEQQVIINNLGSTTNLPPGHLPTTNSICIPVCYGKECIGVVLLANRFSGYVEEMEKPLLAWAQSLGQMLKMYAVLFETETGQSFFDMSLNMPLIQNPYGNRLLRKEYAVESPMPGRLPHAVSPNLTAFDFNANHFRRASISNIQISKPTKPTLYLGKIGKSRSSGNVFTSNDRVNRNTLGGNEAENNVNKSLHVEINVEDVDQRVSNRNYTDSPCSSISSVSESLGEEYQDPMTLFEEIENEMLKSAELSLALFKAVQDSILILDQDLNITTMNPSAKKFFGISTNNQSPNSTNPSIGQGSQIISVRDLIPDNSTQHLNWSEVCNPNGISWYRGKALAKCRNNINNYESNSSSNNNHRASASSLLMASHSSSTTVNNYVDILSNAPLSPNSLLNPFSEGENALKKQDFSRLVPITISVTSFFFKEEIYFSVTVTDESSKEDMKDKMKFIAFLSHELRNPIQVIVSGVQCLVDIFKDNEDSDDMDNGKSIIKSISSSSDFISHIINDMIDLTKLESGHMKVVESSFNIREKVEQIVEMLKIYQLDKNIDISYHIDENVPQSLYSDATKLQQIILNIMSNSCKYTKSGTVKLYCSYENVIENGKPKKIIVFKIQDTGVGIEKEEIPKIFRIYRRLHRKQHEVSGSGIGLALSKLLSDILGCTIKVESEKNVGTTFTVLVPYRLNPNVPETAQQHEEVKNPGIPTEEMLKGKRALIVDDNELIRKLVKNMLKMCECEEAENGFDALRKCEEQKFDFIILDIIMPLIDGFETAKILRNERKLKTPILALTGNSLQEEIDALLNIGVNKVMIKPIKRFELFSELRDVLT